MAPRATACSWSGPTPPPGGRIFGFHRAADTAGAVVGPAPGLGLHELLDHQVRPVLVIAVVPGAMLLLRAGQLGLCLGGVIIAHILHNTVHALAANPFWAVSDRVPRHVVVASGLGFFAVGHLGLGLEQSQGWVFLLLPLLTFGTAAVILAAVMIAVGGRFAARPRPPILLCHYLVMHADSESVGQPAVEHVELAVETFRMLADVTRLQMLWALRDHELSVNELASVVGKPPASMSQHLAKLRLARLVSTRREGTKVFYRLDNSHVRQLVEDAVLNAEHAGADVPAHHRGGADVAELSAARDGRVGR